MDPKISRRIVLAISVTFAIMFVIGVIVYCNYTVLSSLGPAGPGIKLVSCGDLNVNQKSAVIWLQNRMEFDVSDFMSDWKYAAASVYFLKAVGIVFGLSASILVAVDFTKSGIWWHKLILVLLTTLSSAFLAATTQFNLMDSWNVNARSVSQIRQLEAQLILHACDAGEVEKASEALRLVEREQYMNGNTQKGATAEGAASN